MRSVTLTGYDFQVTDDPQGALSDFLGFATCSTSRTSDQIYDQLQPGGRGYTAQDAAGAYEIESVDDIPGGFFVDDAFVPPEGPDWWVVWTQRPGHGTSYSLVAGNELRHLFATAAALWKQRPSP